MGQGFLSSLLQRFLAYLQPLSHHNFTLHFSPWITKDDRRKIHAARQNEEESAAETDNDKKFTVQVHSPKHDMCSALNRGNINYFSSRRFWVLECYRSSPRSSTKQPKIAVVDYRTARLKVRSQRTIIIWKSGAHLSRQGLMNQEQNLVIRLSLPHSNFTPKSTVSTQVA